MPIELDSFIWPATGTDPREIATTDEAVYRAGEQPIASFDNFVNRMLTEDLHNLEGFVNAHGEEHEAGGPQEINLSGLSLGEVATLVGDGESDELRWLDEDGDAVVRVDIEDAHVRAFPEFTTLLETRSGLSTGNHLFRSDGDVIYDHDDDYFHRARHADKADFAEEAGSLAGFDGSEYLKGDEDETITGDWTFEPPIDADILGNAATADWADKADEANWAEEAQEATFADQADFASEAQNAQYLRGMSPQDIIDEATGKKKDSWFKIDIDISIEISTKIKFKKKWGSWSVKSSSSTDDEDEFEDEGPYDQVRVRVYHEATADWPDNKSYLRLRINEEDRARYSYTKITRNSIEDEIEYEEVDDNWAWPIADCKPQEFSVTEYEISAPSTIGDIDRHYPTISNISQGTNNEVSGVLKHGKVKTNMDKIHSVDLESRAEGTAKVEYWGRNFDEE